MGHMKRRARMGRSTGIANIDKIIRIDHSPIGRTPRSNPATYTGLFSPIREFYSLLPESRERGYKPGRFSFNVKGGRCEACQGDGLKRIEMNFLPDVYVTCDVCRGKRYNHETLQVKFKHHSVSDLLELTIEEALPLMETNPQIRPKLQTLLDVGLGYVHLGQSSTTLSGGEAQRVKLAKELSRRQTGKTFYVLDEPTTGLHFEDVRKLLEVLQRLVDLGNTVLVIEHNLDVMRSADYIVDLGPDGGEDGGRVIATGTPEQVMKSRKSFTGESASETAQSGTSRMSSEYSLDPIDLSGLKTISLKERGGKVQQRDFASVWEPNSGIQGLIDSLPKILAGNSFRSVVAAIGDAGEKGKPIIWGMGGHVIKCGLAPVLINLMKDGYATGFAMNGAAAIHDFEIALAGQTSEDVEAVLPDGRFGAAEETGREWNVALIPGLGAGEALGKALQTLAPAAHADASLLVQAYRAKVPVTVHIGIGTDTPHTHPAVNAEALGAATHRDFRLFCSMVTELNDGGVYINVGSAVVLPEVFLKAISCVRNLGHEVRDFTTVNLDFLQHYRPRVNVVERPHAQAGGKGYSLTGHHEIMIPLLAASLIEGAA